MDLKVTYDSEGSPNEVIVYSGALVSEMTSALDAYLTANHPLTYQKFVRRWWTKAQVQASNGLEPELRLMGTVGLDVWKVIQNVGS